MRTSLNNSQTAVDKKEKKQKGTKKKTQLIPAITSRQTGRQSKLEFKGKNGQNEQAKQKKSITPLSKKAKESTDELNKSKQLKETKGKDNRENRKMKMKMT